jgi:hypothetical protein
MKLIAFMTMLLFISSVHADSFDVEWVRFEKDFKQLNERQNLTAIKKTPKKQLPAIATSDQTSAFNQENLQIPQVNPEIVLKESDKLGYQVSDPVVREKIMKLYSRPDVIVQQYVIPFN